MQVSQILKKSISYDTLPNNKKNTEEMIPCFF